jgi:arabinofuranosyltransferase
MPSNRSHVALTIVVTAAAAFYAAFIARTSFRVDGQPFFTLVDDAMISMRYAQHLAEGHGLVWNVGRAPIEGFTNLGWVLLMSLFHSLRFPQNSISLCLMTTSAVILVGNAIVMQRICLKINPSARMAPLLAAGITAFYFPLVFWSLRGMEVGLLVLLANLAVLAALEVKPGAPLATLGVGLLLSAALVVRLDAMLQAFVILTYVLAFKHGGRHQAWLAVCIVAATLVGILVFQQAYFGDSLPNTYYQKIAGGGIVERIRHGMLVFLQYALRDVLVLSLVAGAGLLLFRELRTTEAMLLAGLFIAQCAYSVWVGGDYAEPEVASANRFIAQGVPALIALFAIVTERSLSSWMTSSIGTRLAWITTLAAGIAAVLVISGPPWYRWVDDNAPLLRSDIRRVRAGLAIAAHTSPEVVIAVHAAGQIPYYSRRQTIDLLGLNDPVIARGPRRTSFYPGHDKWNYEYSIGQLTPDLIADNWIHLADYIGRQSAYRKLSNGMYVRTGTTLVGEIRLQEAFP